MSDPMNGQVLEFNPSHTVRFFGKNGEQVGVFDFDTSPATFAGDTDAAARVFVDAVIRMWGERQRNS